MVKSYTITRAKTPFYFQSRPFGNVWLYFRLLQFEGESYLSIVQPGMLLNILQCARQPLDSTGFCILKNLIVPRLKKPGLGYFIIIISNWKRKAKFEFKSWEYQQFPRNKLESSTNCINFLWDVRILLNTTQWRTLYSKFPKWICHSLYVSIKF